jgi:hypothetical protein
LLSTSVDRFHRNYPKDRLAPRLYGQGALTTPNGRKYVGEFRDNKYIGQGAFIMANGNFEEVI